MSSFTRRPRRSFSLPGVVALVGLSLGTQLSWAAIPTEILGETKITGVPGQGFGSTMLALRGNTLVAKTNVYIREGTNWNLNSTLGVVDSVTPAANPTAVAISPDEQTIVAGAPAGDGDKGAAYVFVRSGTSWAQQAMLQPIEGTASDRIGAEVAIQGEWIVVGAPEGSELGNFSTGPGSAYVFRNTGGAWTQVKRLRPDDGHNGNYFGETLAISGDRIVVGAAGDNNALGQNTGAVYVFERDAGGAGNWGQTAKLIPPKRDTVGSFFFFNAGRAVDLAGDTIAIGSQSASFVYRFSAGGVWTLEGDTLRAAPDVGTQVTSIKLNEAGDTFVASDYQPGGQVGEAYVFTRVGAGWSSTGTLKASDGGRGRFFGWKLDVSGETITVNDSSGNVYVYAPDYGDETKVTSFVRKSLYYENADNSPSFPKNGAAFRFKTLLFATDQGDPQKRVRAQVESIGSLFGAAERARAKEAEDRARLALAELPSSAAYQTLLLDILYDQVSAEALFLKDLLVKADLARLGPPSVAGGLVIDDEIRWYEMALPRNRTALQFYADLLKDDLEHPEIAPPLGYNLFRERVPGRALMPAMYLDTNDAPKSVTATAAPLFNGFKDLVLLFDLLRDYGRASANLTRLRWARNQGADRDNAPTIVGEAQRFLQIQRDVLLAVFPSGLPAAGDPSGLAESIASVEQSIAELAELQQMFKGNQNPLGFEGDFLMLVQKFQGQNADIFDSFNSIKEWLDPNFTSRHLGYASQRLGQARSSYATFRGFQDEIREQFEGSTVTFDFRLFEIVGASPGEPGYDTPASNPGGEIWQQFQSIEAARLNIRKNETNIANVWRQVQIEVQKASDLREAYIRHGSQQATLTEYIGHINAAQASANALSQALSIEKLTTGLFLGVFANAAVQGAGEELKGQLEAEKERLAGLQQAEIVGIESGALVKTLLLELNALAVESQEAALLLKQEAGRLAALSREKANLERRIDERNADLASRFYADPAHRLQSQHDTLEANQAFADAQRWIFFMARALEYKWNAPFVHSFAGRTWRSETLFQLRNAEELARFYQAMVDYDGGIEGTRVKDDYFDWFSVREDFLGYRRVNDQGQPLLYADPATGQQIGAIEAFRRQLKRLRDSQGQIRLDFSTVRQIPGGTFFRGARYLPNGQVDPAQRGLYLDKINWMKIRLPGTHNPNRNRTFITGSLTYAGTSYLRNEAPGRRSVSRPDRLLDEWTPYTTRYWYFSTARTGGRPAAWQFREALSAPGVQMWLTRDPRLEGSPAQIDVLPSVQQIDAFKERSVAASNWRLILPTSDLGETLLDIDELDDIEIYFYHYAVARP
jgi:hypothetical protein